MKKSIISIRSIRRIAKLGGYFLLGLIVILSIGRLVQKSLDSIYHGERSPYLQMPAPQAMSLRWQSGEDYKGKISLGELPGSLNRHIHENDADEHHELRISNLKPLTRYYYSAGSETSRDYQGNDFWFVTPPKIGESIPVRFWVTGDQGQAGIIQQQVRDAMLQWLEDNPREGRAYLDFWLTTGDNAYKSGTNQQFQDAFFEPYKNILRNIPVWPAYGNHDARRWAFFNIFSLPRNGESGGVPSRTEHYYSFNYANIHFVFLDSHESDRDQDGRMARWLTTDLKANSLPWTIVVFHHPPYSKGSHNSDNKNDSNGRLYDMRENFVPILERYDVDLVLTGHSHVYERSHFMTCHYGNSSSLKDNMVLDRDGSFTKSAQRASNQGTVYAVIGSSSKTNEGPLDHPVMDVAKSEAGSMVVDVNGNELIARFISDSGFATDQFTLNKLKDFEPRDTKDLCK